MTAALAAGNAVIAKPAEQTSLVAARAAELILESGVPGSAFQLVPGPGRVIGNQLINDPRIAGVAFTGSTETAQVINQALAKRPGVPLPLIEMDALMIEGGVACAGTAVLLLGVIASRLSPAMREIRRRASGVQRITVSRRRCSTG